MTDGSSQARPAVFVDRGAQLIEQQFEKHPQLMAEMYGVAGRAYADLGVDRPAIEYARLQLQTLRVQRADTRRIAKSLMLLAEISLSAYRNRDAEEHARRAVDLLPKEDALLPEALALLARAQVRIVKWTEARHSVDAARTLLGAGQANSSPAAAWLLFVEASLANLEGKVDEATALYERSIEEAIAAQGPLSRAAIDIRLWRARRLIEDESREGLAYLDAAVSAMEALGGTYRLRAALDVASLQMQLSFNSLAPYEESVSVLRGVKSRLEADGSPLPQEVRAQIDFYTGWALMGSGDIAAGSALLLRSADVLEGSTQNLWKQFEIFQGVGFALLYVGDHESADKAFRRTISIREEMGLGTSSSTIPYFLVALNLIMQGRPKEAEEFLSKAPRFVAVPGLVGQFVIDHGLTRARLAGGNISGALQALPRVSETIEKENTFPEFKHSHGEVLCASGDPTHGLELMLSAIAITGKSFGQNHPDLAKMRADAGLCALRMGDRPQAEELAALARRAFQAQPNVSPWFKEPLKRLDKQLGIKSI
jgi:tetratricopeptide (TPR) repeat protein